MPRRPRRDDLPSFTEMLRETGHGWIVDLARLLVWIVFVGGSFALIYYLAVTGLTNAFQQIGSHS